MVCLGDKQGSAALSGLGKVTVKMVGDSNKPMGRQGNSNGRRRGRVNKDCMVVVQSPRCSLQMQRLFVGEDR